MKNKAFTLIETVLAITFVTVVMTAVSSLVMLTIHSNQRNIHKLQALAYAQEGLEVMRYIRDSNWKQNYAWNGGAALWGADFDLSEGQSKQLYLREEMCPVCWSFGGDGVLENSDGFEFVRSIEIEAIQTGMVEVNSVVTWEDKGVMREVELSTYLTDWR